MNLLIMNIAKQWVFLFIEPFLIWTLLIDERKRSLKIYTLWIFLIIWADLFNRWRWSLLIIECRGMVRIMTQWEAASEDTQRVYGKINKHCQYIGYFNKVTTHMNVE